MKIEQPLPPGKCISDTLSNRVKEGDSVSTSVRNRLLSLTVHALLLLEKIDDLNAVNYIKF